MSRNCRNIFSCYEINTNTSALNAGTGALHHNLESLWTVVSSTMMFGSSEKPGIVGFFQISH